MPSWSGYLPSVAPQKEVDWVLPSCVGDGEMYNYDIQGVIVKGKLLEDGVCLHSVCFLPP